MPGFAILVSMIILLANPAGPFTMKNPTRHSRESLSGITPKAPPYSDLTTFYLQFEMSGPSEVFKTIKFV